MLLFYFFKDVFIYLKESALEQEGQREVQREAQREFQADSKISLEPNVGLYLQDPEIMTWTRRLTDCATQAPTGVTESNPNL